MTITIRKAVTFLLIFLLSGITSAELVGVPTYYHNNVAGSPVAATSSSGALLWTTDYLPYGEKYATDNNASSNKIWFTGHVQDAPNGLVYMEARYYDPEVGRFMAIDPVGFTEANPQSFNRYAYAHNNPYKYVDPDGRDAMAIVFTEYRVSTPIGKIGGLGHAGVLMIDNKSGATRYYEYGRYGKNDAGLVHREYISDVKIGKDGNPTADSLNKVLGELSAGPGKGSAVTGVYIPGADFKKMEAYAKSESEAAKNGDTTYNLCTNNCGSFMKNTIEAGGVKLPSMVDPRPNSYINELKNAFQKN